VDERGRLHLCPKAVARRVPTRPPKPAPHPPKPTLHPSKPVARPQRPAARRPEPAAGPPRAAAAAKPAARPPKPATRPPRPAPRPAKPASRPRPAPASRRIPAIPEPVTWDVLANRHVRCGKCHEPVRVTKDRGRVALHEIDGSAPHDCAREPLTVLTLARADARAAVERTVRALAERKAASERAWEQPVAVQAPPPPTPIRALRPKRERAEAPGSDAGASRECPSCGKLMAGSGDTAVCLHCGA